MKKFPRYCSVTGQGMFDGYVIDQGRFYAKSKQALLEIIAKYYPDYMTADQTDEFDEEAAFEDEVFYWTDWVSSPEDDYHQPPQTLLF
jgi:hypothetical protein